MNQNYWFYGISRVLIEYNQQIIRKKAKWIRLMWKHARTASQLFYVSISSLITSLSIENEQRALHIDFFFPFFAAFFLLIVSTRWNKKTKRMQKRKQNSKASFTRIVFYAFIDFYLLKSVIESIYYQKPQID